MELGLKTEQGTQHFLFWWQVIFGQKNYWWSLPGRRPNQSVARRNCPVSWAIRWLIVVKQTLIFERILSSLPQLPISSICIKGRYIIRFVDKKSMQTFQAENYAWLNVCTVDIYSHVIWVSRKIKAKYLLQSKHHPPVSHINLAELKSPTSAPWQNFSINPPQKPTKALFRCPCKLCRLTCKKAWLKDTTV